MANTLAIKVGDRVFYRATTVYRVVKITSPYSPDDDRKYSLITMRNAKTGRMQHKSVWTLNYGWTVERVQRRLLLPQGA